MTIGEKIHELRKARKISQKRMAELFNVTVEELTNPDTKVELGYDLKKEIERVKENSKKFKVFIICSLLLFAGTFAAALYTRFNSYSESLVLLLVILSASFMLLAFCRLS